MDESKVNKRSEVEICCNISSASGVESRHYKCVDLQAGDAETICNTLIGEMVEDKIPYKEKIAVPRPRRMQHNARVYVRCHNSNGQGSA